MVDGYSVSYQYMKHSFSQVQENIAAFGGDPDKVWVSRRKCDPCQAVIVLTLSGDPCWRVCWEFFSLLSSCIAQ